MSTLIDAVRAAINAGLANTRVSLVARVERYDAARGVVDVRPEIPRLNEDGTIEQWPTLYALPVSFPGSSSVTISHEIPIGSRGLIVFHDLPLDGWKAGESEPRGRRSHALSDGVFVPGIDRPGSRELAAQGVEIYAGGPVDFLVRKSDLQTAIDDLKSYVDAKIVGHNHAAPGGTTGNGVSTVSPPRPTAQASTKVKAS